MALYKKLLLAVDLAHDNHEVIEQAAELIPRLEAEAVLVYVIEPMPPDMVAGPFPLGVPAMAGDPELEQARLDNARARLAEYAEQYGLGESEQAVRVGATTDSLLEEAGSRGVDLILVGSHGRKGLSRLLGSTASAIVHQADCDVLTVRVSG